MKKIIRFALLLLLLSACSLPLRGAWAQGDLLYGMRQSPMRPEPTPPGTVALLYYKMTAQIPDFDSWARQTPAYRDASSFNRMAVLEQKVKEMREGYTLLSMQEPLIVEVSVRLSEYSAANHGFFIEDFRADTFFPVSYGDRSYAIVPEGIVDKQWLKVATTAAAEALEAAAKSNEGRLLTLTIFLSPRYADKAAPVSLDGRDYWLILTNVKKMMLYPLGKDTVLWQSDSVGFKDEKRQELLNLYR